MEGRRQNQGIFLILINAHPKRGLPKLMGSNGRNRLRSGAYPGVYESLREYGNFEAIRRRNAMKPRVFPRWFERRRHVAKDKPYARSMPWFRLLLRSNPALFLWPMDWCAASTV